MIPPPQGAGALRAKPLRATPSAPWRALWTYTTSGDTNREPRGREARGRALREVVPVVGAIASGVSLLVVCGFDSLLDAPRLVVLLAMMLWFATGARRPANSGATALPAAAAIAPRRAGPPAPAPG